MPFMRYHEAKPGTDPPKSELWGSHIISVVRHISMVGQIRTVSHHSSF